MPTALAIFAHPDDIEFVAAGTLLLLKERGWDLHYLNLCSGNCGSLVLSAEETARVRLAEAQAAAALLGAQFHAPICGDLELEYTTANLRKVVAVVREAAPRIVFTHAPSDYMEDHMCAARLAVSAAFSRGVPNFESDPPRAHCAQDVTIYHAMPHGLRDQLRRRVHAGLYVDTASVQALKLEALAAHKSQAHWLGETQAMGSYLQSMEDASREVGRLSGRFELAEGWRRHSHLGFSAHDDDPLRDALGERCVLDEQYEHSLDL